MKFFKSIRWQLQMWHGLLLMAVIGAFGFTAYQLEKTERMRAIDGEMQHRLSLLVNTLRAGSRDESRRGRSGDAPPPQLDEEQFKSLLSSSSLKSMFGDDDHFYFAIWMRGTSPVARSANAPREIPRPAEHDASTRVRQGEFREAFIFAAPVDCVLVGRSIADVNGVVRFHALLLAGAGAALLAAGLAIGWWLTARALRPVREIGTAAKRIASGDLSQRINASETESELGELAAVLNTTFARLEAAFAQQARFTADAAHELRTPLTVLLTQTQATLARERSAGDYRDALQTNQATAQRMRRLVESLLQLARLDAGQEPLRPVPCDLSVIAADCSELLRPLADARRIEMKLELADAKCDADPERIAQVITNLVKNAIDHNHDGGELRIRTYREAGLAIVEVMDHGVGICAEDLPHIFERFYRADSSRSESASRNGLGLAISKAIIDAHGGRIDVASSSQTGTVFKLALTSN